MSWQRRGFLAVESALCKMHTQGHRSRCQEAGLRECDVGELGKRQALAPDLLLSFCVYAPDGEDHPCRHPLGTQNLYFGDEG